MASDPTEVANLAIDAIGVNVQLGDIEQGGREADVLLRAYRKCRQDLLRGAPWAFARKQVPLQCLGDASGATAGVNAFVPGSQFQYEYRYPNDCQRVRYVPWNPFANTGAPAGNIQPPNPLSPQTTGMQTQLYGLPVRPSLYLITNDPNIVPGAGSNAPYVQGESPGGSTVIMSNVKQAQIIYTFDVIYPSLWDALFTGAMISYLASEVAVALWASRDPKMGRVYRADQIAIAKQKIMEARIADGNEMTVSTSHIPDWMTVRRSGGVQGWGGGWDAGVSGSWGCWGGGWGGSIGFSDGSAY